MSIYDSPCCNASLNYFGPAFIAANKQPERPGYYCAKCGKFVRLARLNHNRVRPA